ncbi:DUF5694 domain-containing protein [uncultured Algimonas sp.]|uniref:DUF5694 domain-containing protein n=1 Tax=uncultured Algimonas sp. TaxID=1547920 RepID=UPI002635F152|nr:DUF5694 domain-containing protein [uncultured Algimonas sp.]
MTKAQTPFIAARLKAGLRLLLVWAVVGAAGPASAQSGTDDVTVMVLGTYHFSNPGRDLNNLEAEDVLAPKRQAELAILADVLAEFEPTAIAVERVAEPPYDDPVWAEYEPSKLSSVRNERIQIGHRLAALTGIERVYAVDEQPVDGEPDYFPYGPLSEFAKDADREAELSALSNWDGFNAEFEALQKTGTIPALLMLMNGPAFTDDFYWNAIKLGAGERQPGPELAAYWFLRNAKIVNKLVQVAEPGDRIVMVYGAGHGHWLRHIIEEMDGYRLEPVLPYLQRADRLSRE